MNHRVALIAVLAAALLMLTVRAGSLPLFEPDETRFARTSVEMLRLGDPVVPHFQGRPRLVKPPLLHWVQSSVFRVFGSGSFAARLHSIAATLGSLLLVAWVARRRFGDAAAPWAAATMMTMPLVFVHGRVGTLDALLAIHVLAVLALDLAPPERPSRFHAAAIGAVLGLGFLAKGPVGVVAPLLMMLAGRTASRRVVLGSRSDLLRGVAAWCVVVLPWALVFVQRVGVGRTSDLLREEVLDRYFAGTTHVEPAWYYLALLPLVLLPWSVPLISGLWRVWRLRREPAARTARYLAAAFVVGLLFFSLGRGKLPGYVLPLAPLAALLVTWELSQQSERAHERQSTAVHLLAATMAALAVACGMAYRSTSLAPIVHSFLPFAGSCFAVAAAIGGIGAVGRRPRLAHAAAASAMALVLGAAVWHAGPELGRTRSVAPLVAAVPQLHGDRPVVTVAIKVPGLAFYLDRSIEVVELDGLAARLADADRPLFVIVDVDLPEVPVAQLDRLVEIGAAGKYRVFTERERWPGS